MSSTTHSAESEFKPTPGKQADNKLNLLIQRSASGDETAFEQLYQITSRQLFSVLLRMLRVNTVAEEALQETYVKIWHNAKRYNSDLGTPFTWMISIARYHALDVLRKRQTREDREIHESEANGVSIFDNTDSRDQDYATAEILSMCLERLDVKSRNCILKAYCEGYSHDELSKQLSSPLGSVKSWIRRGLLSLRECVNELS